MVCTNKITIYASISIQAEIIWLLECEIFALPAMYSVLQFSRNGASSFEVFFYTEDGPRPIVREYLLAASRYLPWVSFAYEVDDGSDRQLYYYADGQGHPDGECARQSGQAAYTRCIRERARLLLEEQEDQPSSLGYYH